MLEDKQYQLEDEGYKQAKIEAENLISELMDNKGKLDVKLEDIEPAIDSVKKPDKLPEVLHLGWRVHISFVVPKPIINTKEESTSIYK